MYKFSKNEIKIIRCLVANIKKTDTELEYKTMRLLDLGFTNKEMKDHQYLNDLCENIMKKPFLLPYTHFYVNWFSLIGVKNGIITYKFVDDLKPFLMEVNKNFTSYFLSNILLLTSGYSINVYELLKQLEQIGYRKFELNDFLELLKIPESYQIPNIKILLDKCAKDIEKNTDIKFTYSLIKTGKKYTHLNFKIMKNPKNDIHNFIKKVRQNYVNQEIMKIGVYGNHETVSVNPDGKLYAITNPDIAFTAEESQKIWNSLFKNQDKLLPFITQFSTDN